MIESIMGAIIGLAIAGYLFYEMVIKA